MRVDSYLRPGVDEAMVDRWVRSACVLCSNGCGLDIAVADDEIVGVRGRADDRVNRGRLGPKGLYGWQGQSRDRLTRPLVRDGDGRLVETDLDTAMGQVVARSRQLLNSHGGLSHGFYTSGQLMAEEYYTLAVIGKAGIGTPHMDGNTRLCTATAAAAMKESFGTDGQPGSYADIEHCDALFLFGHNVAETQTVLWARMLDRLDGPDPPRLVCVDPRRTAVAARAEVHLPLRPGTNVALVNGLVRELLVRGWVDHDWVAAHTVGLEELARTVDDYTPQRVAQICGIDPADLTAAAEVFGTAQAVLSTVLQGFYQSHQATAAAVGVNNLHLLRGMLGRPGAGVLQMNGQPTAQNNRECGADGDLPGFRNWDNDAHVAELAELWDVDPLTIPHWSPPTHAMQLFRYVEQGSIRFLWIAGTNPAVSMPELARIRAALGGEQCFVVVSDAYRTETTELADVVLPVALWGERTGTFTNADRTVHLSEQAIDPPGEARSDLKLWLDYARRMGFRSRSGQRLPWWDTPEEAFTEWTRATAGRPCDQTGLTYDLLRARSGVQWPVTAEATAGTERLYTEGRFNTDTDYCETYGHDLLTGATINREQHRALRADGRARLRAVADTAPPGAPDDDYPMRLITGRTVTQFHTRTKTGRVNQLDAAAPAPWVELATADATRLGLAEADLVRVSTPRGTLRLPVRVTDIGEGTVFVPFHYGDRAANELTMTVWDPVSKQPQLKLCGARIDPDRE
ncbi:molybdopterin oxidoreductase family protein [Pseudonocardia nantongensis]|uniref:molybdopterin oxidoreductase family protein n=1 Tax=Pseudonocardia nantongensis TaxID=1181885 RepID=UPI00397C135F